MDSLSQVQLRSNHLDRLHNPAAANTYVNGISDDMIIVGCFAWQNTQNVTIDKILIYCSSHRVHFPFSCLWAKMRPILYIYKHQGKWGVSTIVSSNVFRSPLLDITTEIPLFEYTCINKYLSHISIVPWLYQGRLPKKWSSFPLFTGPVKLECKQ